MWVTVPKTGKPTTITLYLTYPATLVFPLQKLEIHLLTLIPCCHIPSVYLPETKENTI